MNHFFHFIILSLKWEERPISNKRKPMRWLVMKTQSQNKAGEGKGRQGRARQDKTRQEGKAKTQAPPTTGQGSVGIDFFQLVRSGHQNGDILKTQTPKFPLRKVIIHRHWHIIFIDGYSQLLGGRPRHWRNKQRPLLK
jgi:hypothetical protein